VYHGPGKRAWEETPRPAIQNATDAIVRITTSTICGTDLHILKGDLPSVTPDRIFGHEGVGVVTEVGAAVAAVRPGDRVIISCVTACGKCDYCRKGMYSHKLKPTGLFAQDQWTIKRLTLNRGVRLDQIRGRTLAGV
jgi:alcohol dehydrogenase